jgi:hypothetical protein
MVIQNWNSKTMHPFIAKVAACLLVAVALATLPSCTPRIGIDLLNQSGSEIQTESSSKSANNADVPNGQRKLIKGSNPLLLHVDGVNKNYDLSALPSKFVRTTSHGLVLSVVLREDMKLYLLEAKEASTKVVEPQPTPFPLPPN